MTFASRLSKAQERFGPICVGADPHAAILGSWGLPDSPAGLQSFSEIFTEAFAGRVASIKPQVAFFERHGSRGLAVLEELIGAFREAGTLVIADAKRGDIGSTMAGYADAWLGDGPLGSDAVTLSPYLGVGSLEPAFELAAQNDRGIFVLAATSNPEGAAIQGAQTAPVTRKSGSADPGQDRIDLPGDVAVAQRVLAELGAYNVSYWPGVPGSLGAVIGATTSQRLAAWGVDAAVLHGPILAPGVGAQGASVQDAEGVARGNLLCIPVSRAILRAGPDVDALQNAQVALK
ncbi:orotidine-5'-phosphate decarboxylase [Flaviflexus massiliensis]|uniref:orotidine-5'-phosphate decarboxylase n=1 Tax=Flaviflexus massiliensis TaxID=1522309 RepID=UPI0006D599BC|nr:orotidine-5'-phosphate decarboxylase [Flaviflexus massiliensis]